MLSQRPTKLAVLAVLALGVACTPEQSFTEIQRIDSFQQQRRNAVDLLVVIDNSCSMVEEQDNLARNFDALISTFENADVDWRLAVTTTDTEADRYRGLLMGGDDEVILRWPQSDDPTAPRGELDRVAYDRTWAFQPGHALMLSGDKLRSTYNDSVGNYCASANEYASGSFGTPGERNPSCDTGQVVPPDNVGPDAGPRRPNAGDVFVSELMPRSSGMDSSCEWVELTSRAKDTLDLTGLEIGDLGRNHALFPSGTVIPPNGVLVIGRSADPAQSCGTPVDVAFAAGFTLNDDVRVIDRDTPDGAELFSEQVAQGTIGGGIEMGLEGARLVFEPEFYAEQNQSWLRDDANLSILFVSDEDDTSPYPVDAYLRYFTDLKGDRAYRDRSAVNLSAVVGSERPPVEDIPACETSTGVAWYGERYVVAANLTEGLVESICEQDFAPIVSRLGLTLSGLESEFALSELPQLNTLAVKLYESASTASFVRELVRDVDFTYDCAGNKLVFVEEQVPPSEWYITVTYERLPGGMSDACSEGAR